MVQELERLERNLSKYLGDQAAKENEKVADLLEKAAGNLRSGEPVDIDSTLVEAKEARIRSERVSDLVTFLSQKFEEIKAEFESRGIPLPESLEVSEKPTEVEEEITPEARVLAKKLPSNLLITSLEKVIKTARMAPLLSKSGGNLRIMEELSQKSDEELLGIDCFGPASLAALKEALRRKVDLWQKFQAGEISEEELGKWEEEMPEWRKKLLKIIGESEEGAREEKILEPPDFGEEEAQAVIEEIEVGEQLPFEEFEEEEKEVKIFFWEGRDVVFEEIAIGNEFQSILEGRKRPLSAFDERFSKAKEFKSTHQLRRIAKKIQEKGFITEITISDTLFWTWKTFHEQIHLNPRDEVAFKEALRNYFERLRIIPEQRLLSAIFGEQEGGEVPLPAEKEEGLKQAIFQVVSSVTPREQRVLILRFGLDDWRPRLRKEIAEEFNVTPARIGQIERKALRKLRHPSRSKRLAEFLPHKVEQVE